jgi:hypothetical protein
MNLDRFGGIVRALRDPLTSEEGKKCRNLRTFICKPRPESGLDCLTCAIFAQKRFKNVLEGSGWTCSACTSSWPTVRISEGSGPCLSCVCYVSCMRCIECRACAMCASRTF